MNCRGICVVIVVIFLRGNLIRLNKKKRGAGDAGGAG